MKADNIVSGEDNNIGMLITSENASKTATPFINALITLYNTAINPLFSF